jgi:arginyl-tRNA synthetase
MRDAVATVVSNTLLKLKERGALTLEQMPAFAIDAPKKAEHGDFATNAAMMLAKPERKKPRDIAELIKEHLADEDGIVDAVEIAGPGFINFRLSAAFIQKTIRKVLERGDEWGKAERPTGKKVMVEFVSANPTGPLHLGHARGAIMGDAVSRLLSAAGHDVVREYYINDFGKQVETLGETVHARYRELFGQSVTLEKGQYPAAYVIEIAKALKDEDGDKWLNAEQAEWLPRCIEVGIRENLKDIKTTLEVAGIEMDTWFSEATLHEDGKVAAIAARYTERGETYEAEQARGSEDKKRRDGSKAAEFKAKQLGGTFLETSKYGDEEDRIILRHDGTPVYLTADLAYHDEKFARGFDRMIDVWGADHAGHVPRIRAGMEALGRDPAQLDFLLVQMVRLLKGGEEVKISKRSGEVYELRELIEEAGGDVVRFIFLMRSANSQFDFDLELATQQSNDNPVFYCQYGHARCVNVLKKAEEKGQAFGGVDALTDEVLARLELPEEKAMLMKMADLPGLVASAADAMEPHRLLYFAQGLIADFHSYFTQYKHTHRIVSDDQDATQARLGLVAALRVTLKQSLGLLGISAPDWMEAPSRDDGDDGGEED